MPLRLDLPGLEPLPLIARSLRSADGAGGRVERAYGAAETTTSLKRLDTNRLSTAGLGRGEPSRRRDSFSALSPVSTNFDSPLDPSPLDFSDRRGRRSACPSPVSSTSSSSSLASRGPLHFDDISLPSLPPLSPGSAYGQPPTPRTSRSSRANFFDVVLGEPRTPVMLERTRFERPQSMCGMDIDSPALPEGGLQYGRRSSATGLGSLGRRSAYQESTGALVW